MRPAPYPCRFLDRAVSSRMDSSCSCDRWPDKLRGHMERDAAEYKHVVLALIFLRQCSLRRSFGDLSRAAHSRKFSAVCRAFRVASSESNPIDEGVCDELALRR